MTAAPLKLNPQSWQVQWLGNSPRSHDRGPIEAILAACCLMTGCALSAVT